MPIVRMLACMKKASRAKPSTVQERKEISKNYCLRLFSTVPLLCLALLRLNSMYLRGQCENRCNAAMPAGAQELRPEHCMATCHNITSRHNARNQGRNRAEVKSVGAEKSLLHFRRHSNDGAAFRFASLPARLLGERRLAKLSLLPRLQSMR